MLKKSLQSWSLRLQVSGREVILTKPQAFGNKTFARIRMQRLHKEEFGSLVDEHVITEGPVLQLPCEASTELGITENQASDPWYPYKHCYEYFYTQAIILDMIEHLYHGSKCYIMSIMTTYRASLELCAGLTCWKPICEASTTCNKSGEGPQIQQLI